MKITLIVVGKTENKELRSSIADYSKRIAHYASFDALETTEEKLAKAIARFDRVFLLDSTGMPYNSVGFSTFIEKQLNSGVKSVAFVIGGPFGFTDEVKACASGSISLSAMTFPHDLVRVIFLEQLYRAFTILKNEKYHHA